MSDRHSGMELAWHRMGLASACQKLPNPDFRNVSPFFLPCIKLPHGLILAPRVISGGYWMSLGNFLFEGADLAWTEISFFQ